MKKTFTVFLLLSSLSSGLLRAQWMPLYEDHTKVFTDIHFPTGQDGYVTGWDTSAALVMRTTDAGQSWNHINLFHSFVHRVKMTSAQSGYIIKGGAPVSLLHTTDGFDSWDTFTLDSCFIVFGMEFINDSTGYYLNNSGRFRMIKNYGNDYFHVFDDQPFNLLDFAGPLTGYLAGGAELRKTTDGGQSWFTINDELDFLSTAIHFSSPDTGYLASDSALYKTTDGGFSFTMIRNFAADDIIANDRFFMAVGDTGNIAWTSDGGLTWNDEPSGMYYTGVEKYRLEVSPDGVFYLISDAGEIRMRAGNLSVPQTTFPEFSVYPNPARDYTTIRLAQDAEQTDVSVTDNTGRTVLQLRVTGNTIQLPLHRLPPGIYFIRVQDKQQIQGIKKIVVE